MDARATAGGGSKPRIRMITPIWGKDYIDRWLEFSFASHRSRGNIPYLAEHADFELAIVTKSADVEYMQELPRFRETMSGIRVRFVIMDEFFPPSGKVHYGVPLALAFAKGILDLGESAIGTYVILMNADLVLATGSLGSLLHRIRQGYAIVTAQSIRAKDGAVRTHLETCVDRESGVLTIEPRELMRLVGRNLHSTMTGRIVNDPAVVDSTYYHQIFWRVSEGHLAMRGFIVHPLCFRVERLMTRVVCPMDYGFLYECCPEGSFCTLDDSDQYMAIELQERHSESHLLRIAPRDRSLEDRLARLEGEIAAHAAKWTTQEHRRSATGTIHYHEDDLPPDLAQRTAPFEAFVDRILARLPTPVPHTRHFQWLPAVQIYRQQMKDGGATGPVALLDDPRNDPGP